MSTTTRSVPFRRKREGRTDYRKRIKLLMSGKPRLTVRMSLKNIRAQLITFSEKGDIVQAQADTKELKNYGWNYPASNTPSGYLLGMLIAKKAKEKGVGEAILDIGFRKSVPGSTVFAVLKGAVDSGLRIPHGEAIVPKPERLSGKHIAEYAAKLKANGSYEKKFSGYLKLGAKPEDMPQAVETVKQKLQGAS
ncbi:50S ribosomal protein L18 [Candidatus Woesearchaeota archaeon]|nr:50S ribosomal protein L18 [Candidatus Woesearchaeota archaeon]